MKAQFRAALPTQGQLPPPGKKYLPQHPREGGRAGCEGGGGRWEIEEGGFGDAEVDP